MLLIMERLLNLLNLYNTAILKHKFEYSAEDIDHGPTKRRLVSKDYKFIEWLVSEGNINEGKFFTMTEEIQDAGRKIDPPEFETTVKDLETYNKIRKKYLSERLIMFLSIQDDPIKVLIEIIE